MLQAVHMECVLGTVELLELILSYVDLQSIFTTGLRVCRLWNHLVRDSPQLQALLFFRPDSSAASGHLRPPTRTNTLLLRHFGGCLTNTSSDVTNHSVAPLAANSLLVSEPSWCRMLIQQPAANLKLGIWRVATGCVFPRGFENTTEVLELGEPEDLRMGVLVQTMNRLGHGSPWTLYWGEEGMKRLEGEKSSLLVLKARASERAALFEMWETSDMVVKFTQWISAN